ncbi:MAG: serine hydrolase domain-containing protein [Bryobacteraceae bacterium]
MEKSVHCVTLASVFAMTLLPVAAAQLRTGAPEAAGINHTELERAASLLEEQVGHGDLGAASILVARHGVIVLHRGFGRLSSQSGSPAVAPDSIYIVASITKPVTATATMTLVERGLISLGDPVSHYIPEFRGGDKDKVVVGDLLKHTSGMPDMLPENVDLRRAHAPMTEFVKHAIATPLLFAPGSAFRYQSMGVLLAAEIVQRVSGMAVREYDRQQIFEPLEMRHTQLGADGLRLADTVQVWTDPNGDRKDAESWGPNSVYWRNFGAPWGGLHTTTGDLAVLLETFLNGGVYNGKRILSPAAVREMTTDQNGHLNAPWGIGWALGRSKVWNEFGDLVSPKAFGHAGATGTVAWADPETGLICIVLTNRPLDVDHGRLLRLVSNIVAASVEK